MAGLSKSIGRSLRVRDGKRISGLGFVIHTENPVFLVGKPSRWPSTGLVDGSPRRHGGGSKRFCPLLRHLGGRVYLSEVGRNPRAVLGGLHDAQTVHIWALLLCCPWLLFWAIQGRWMSVACGLAVHAPLNVYPILHLRYTTKRVEGYVARVRCGKHAEQTGCTERRDRVSADNRTSLARHR